MAFNTIGSNELREDQDSAEETDDATKIKDFPSIFATELTSFKQGECIIFTIIVVFLCGLSVVGNIGALYANQKRNLRNFFRTCLMSLALSDLIQSVFMSAGYLAQFGAPYVQVWCLGDFMCLFIPFVTTGAVLVGSMTLVGIAMDRYFAVMSSVFGAWNPSKTFCSVSAICVWAMSYGIASPMLGAYSTNPVYILHPEESDVEVDDPEIIGMTLVEMCVSDKTSNAYYYVVVLAIIFIPTLLAFVWLNSIIANKLWIRRRFISVPAAPSQSGLNEALPAATPPPTTISLSTAIDLGPNRKPEEKQMEMTQQQYDHPCHCHGGNKICSYSTLTVPTSMVATTTTTTTITTTTLMKSLETNNLKSNSSTGGNSTKHISSREARHLRMFTIVLILMAVFIFFRLPAWVFLIMRMYGTYTHPAHWILHFSFGILTLASCVLNPLLYTFLAETIQYTMLMKGKLCGLRRYFENCGQNQKSNSSHCCNSNNEKDNEKMSQFQEQKLQNSKNDNGHDENHDDYCKNETSNDGAKNTSRRSDDGSNAKVYTIIPVLQKGIHAT